MCCQSELSNEQAVVLGQTPRQQRLESSAAAEATSNSLISGGPEVRAASREWFVEVQEVVPLNEVLLLQCWLLNQLFTLIATFFFCLHSAAVQFLWLHGDAAQEVHAGSDDWRE